MHGDVGAAGTLTSGGSARSGRLTPRSSRVIARLTSRSAAFLRSARGSGTAFAGSSVAALDGAVTGTRLRPGILRLRELNAAFCGRGRKACDDTNRSSHTEKYCEYSHF